MASNIYNASLLVSDLQLLIELNQELLRNESFPAYKCISDKLKESKDCVYQNDFESLKRNIGFCIRSLQEAPPKNESIGRDFLHRLDLFYKNLVR